MRSVRSADTKPELTVRRTLHAAGLRFRLHAAELPGKPDILFRRARLAVFVHGCFWHGHDCKRGARPPKANADYWRAKIERNRARDATARARLEALGWRVCVIWECQLGALAPVVADITATVNAAKTTSDSTPLIRSGILS